MSFVKLLLISTWKYILQLYSVPFIYFMDNACISDGGGRGGEGGLKS